LKEKFDNSTITGALGLVDKYLKSPLSRNPHTFHIPVMGTGFSIDTSLKVAKFGISSVMSIGDDILIEQMRKYYCKEFGRPYNEISDIEEDHRARRITAYLDLVDELVKQQVRELKATPFEPGSEITRYFEMLPESLLKQAYRDMLTTTNPGEKLKEQEALRRCVVPGSIDVNIMTKIDRDLYQHGKKLPPESSVALSAFRGFAKSTLNSSIVLSAGMNRRLFSYMTHYEDFYPDAQARLKKKIVVKVSDYRSAVVQGKMLSSRGLWVSEYRIESGLNCGGHAFATKGYLMGPILEEFRTRKEALVAELYERYKKALVRANRAPSDIPPEVRITVQGGICSSFEDSFLLKYFEVDGTGWGTPFLLVPEVTNVDEEHRRKLIEADSRDVFLSGNSPMGIPFWNLRTSASEETRLRRIREGKPGSSCPKGFLAVDTEFSDLPLCHASRTFQNSMINKLNKDEMSPEQKSETIDKVMAKTCLCMDLTAGAIKKIGADSNSDAHAAICCGPNIVHFSRTATLEEMVSHIYGRLSLLNGKERPHMFIKELELYIDYLKSEIESSSKEFIKKASKYFLEFKENLLSGAEYYQKMAEEFNQKQRENFINDLNNLREEINNLFSGLNLELAVEGIS